VIEGAKFNQYSQTWLFSPPGVVCGLCDAASLLVVGIVSGQVAAEHYLAQPFWGEPIVAR
jgi:hypothetical protein